MCLPILIRGGPSRASFKRWRVLTDVLSSAASWRGKIKSRRKSGAEVALFSGCETGIVRDARGADIETPQAGLRLRRASVGPESVFQQCCVARSRPALPLSDSATYPLPQ